MTESQTADRIDATHRARNYPDDCSLDAIATALEGRELYDVQLLQKIDPICRRCEEKNQKRRMAGVDLADPQLNDGDRVTMHAIHVIDDDGMRPPHWNIRSVSHAQHPQRDFADCIERGTALVRARATIHTAPDGEQHIIDVDVTNRSPSDQGPDQSVVEQQMEEFVDDSDAHPDGMTVIDRDPEDAPARWPQSERDWLDSLIESHGPLQMQTYSIEHPGPADPNPGEDSR
jgi:hypothetical protein